MTIALNNSFPVEYAGNGSAVTFSYPWKISAAADLLVGFIVGGVYTLQSSGTYTVAGIGNNGGGSITFVTAPANGTTVDLRTQTPETQTTEFANLGAYLPENSTNTMDRIVRQIQDLTRQTYTFGIHGPDEEFTAWPALPPPSGRAGFLLGFDATSGLPSLTVPLISFLTQAQFNTLLNTPAAPTNGIANAMLAAATPYIRTPAEIAAGVTPTNFAYAPTPIIDAGRYGFSASNSSAANVAALKNAIAVAAVSGGTVQLPAGSFACGGTSDVINVPQFVNVRGAGMRATVLNTANDGNTGPLFLLGGPTTGVVKYGCALSDLEILMSNENGTAITCLETVGAYVGRVYIEGAIAASRFSTAVFIDGGSASAFFNVFELVICNHIHIGFDVITSGTTDSTQQTFIQCSVNGDVGTDASSEGLRIRSGCGNGSIWVGGDLEAIGTAFHNQSTGGSITVHGVRFEGNTTDILFDVNANPWTFIGAVNLTAAKIMDNSGTGFENTNYIGCISNLGVPFGNNMIGANVLRAGSATDIPGQFVGYPGQTSDIVQVQNSSNVENWGVNPAGKHTFNNQATTGSATATFTATNKPGSNSSPTKWLPVTVDGVTCYVPLWT